VAGAKSNAVSSGRKHPDAASAATARISSRRRRADVERAKVTVPWLMLGSVIDFAPQGYWKIRHLVTVSGRLTA
jgi:hypothetical protein